MGFDKGLEERISQNLKAKFLTKKMFGGLCFMVNGHMTCGIVGDTLMARVGPKQYETLINKPFAKEMTFTGRPMKGMLFIDPVGIEEDHQLKAWLDHCLSFIQSLPPK